MDTNDMLILESGEGKFSSLTPSTFVKAWEPEEMTRDIAAKLGDPDGELRIVSTAWPGERGFESIALAGVLSQGKPQPLRAAIIGLCILGLPRSLTPREVAAFSLTAEGMLHYQRPMSEDNEPRFSSLPDDGYDEYLHDRAIGTVDPNESGE